jgi:hypothetical protein
MVFSPAVIGEREPPLTPEADATSQSASGSAVRGANRWMPARPVPDRCFGLHPHVPPRLAVGGEVGGIHACGLTCGAATLKAE